jgi:TonB family protein
MYLDRLPQRVQITVLASFLVHLVILGMFGSKKFSEPGKRLQLTEVEFQEERVPSTELEKLMSRIAAPPKPPSRPVVEDSRIAALAELETASFRQVVGIRQKPGQDMITKNDLTRLAALPKLELAGRAPRPDILPVARKIGLVRKQSSSQRFLQAKVVPLAELPLPDFGPEISRKKFQQPEMIINKVKAARRRQGSAAKKRKALNLKRDTYISGEVKNRQILHREYPQVPRWLEEKGAEAEVVINFVVNPDGEVGDRVLVAKTSGYAELDRLAIAALKKFIFAPLPLTTKQVEQKGTIYMRFSLVSR